MLFVVLALIPSTIEQICNTDIEDCNKKCKACVSSEECKQEEDKCSICEKCREVCEPCKEILLVKRGCYQGCLILKDKRCLFCDSVNGYYLDSNTNHCLRTSIRNCLNLKKDGVCVSCLQCEEGLALPLCKSCPYGQYLDINQDCVELTKIVRNCLSYGIKGDCKACKDNYVLIDNDCVKPTEIVNNCLVFAPNTTRICEVCKPNHSFSVFLYFLIVYF